MNSKGKFAVSIISAAALSVMLAGAVAFAQTNNPPPQGQGGGFGRGPIMAGARMMPGIFGTVASVSGDTLTVTSKQFAGPHASSTSQTATTYTVDATNATVFKDNATSSVSAIQSGDTVSVQGTVSGTSVTAKVIRDGVPQMGQGAPGNWKGATSTPGTRTPPAYPQGNGEPVVGGSVSNVSGDTVTITNASNVSYTIDATNATVFKDNATSSLSAVDTGDNIVVQGTVDGNSVTASSIIDQGAPKTSSNSGGGPVHAVAGFFGEIGGFFQHLFGFF